MKRRHGLGIFCAFFASAAVEGARLPTAVTLEADRTDVVIEKNASPVVKFAAAEATNFLFRALGTPVPIENTPRESRVAIILGMNEWSRAAGIDPDSMPTDTYFIKTAPGRIYLAGRDGRYDPMRVLTAVAAAGRDRATLFAVYGFLERFAGCRFYFPGELGEIVPKSDKIEVPNVDVAVTPRCLDRRIYCPKAVWYDDGPLAKNGRRVDWLRKRLGTTQVPCCHGSSRWKFNEKFAKTHPEYFTLLPNGRRYTGYGPAQLHKEGELCFSNPGLRQAVFEECASRFARGEKYVDIMPHDAMQECRCDSCQKAYNFEDRQNFASELIWDYTVDIANRLRKAGLRGSVTQMAYWPYRRIPAIDIPDNVEVMVAETGPFSVANPRELRREHDEIRAWAKKLGRSVSTWTYPHKRNETMLPGIPDATPRAIGEYYNGIADVIFGTFMQSETDRRIFHYLGDYVLSRILWDGPIDVDKIIDEHNRLMFGAGAAEMGEFFNILENRWICGVNGNIDESKIGPATIPPSEGELWTKVYSPETMARLDRLLETAAAKADAVSLEAKRIAFMRKQFFEPLAMQPVNWRKRMAKLEATRWRIALNTAISFRPLKTGRLPKSATTAGNVIAEESVRTAVTARRTENALVFRFDCEEPQMEKIVSYGHRKHDDKATWRDSGIEFFLNPSGDRKTVCHFMINASKVMCDGLEIRKGGEWSVKLDTEWESGAAVDGEIRKDGYVLTVSIPLASLGKDVKDRFPAEFCRNRVLKDGVGDGYYLWGEYTRNYRDVANYGIIDISE